MKKSITSFLLCAPVIFCAALFFASRASGEDGSALDQLRREFEEWKQQTSRELGELREENKQLRAQLESALGKGDAEISPALEEKLKRWFDERSARSGILEVKGTKGNLVTNVRLFGEIRERMEFVDNLTDFDYSLDDNTNFVDSRIRLGVALEFSDWIDALVELQNNSFFGDTSTEFGPNARNRTEDDVEIYQAFITFRRFFGTDAEVRIGRQEIIKGRQFLVGNDDFYSGLSFDAVRVLYEISCLKLEVDAWWARLSDNFADASGTERFADNKRDFFGLYLTWSGIHDKIKQIEALEAYLLLVRDRTNNLYDAETLGTGFSPDDMGRLYINDFVNETRWTAGVRTHGRLIESEARLLQYDVEFAIQSGKAGTAGAFDATTGAPIPGASSGTSGGKIKAFGMEASLRYQCLKWRFKPAFELYYAYASGDKDPLDGDQGTFNPLFQDNHGRLGLSDLFQTENIQAIGMSAMVYPFSRLEIGGSFYYLRLNSTEDFSAPNAVAPLMGEGHRVDANLALEFDLFINYRYSERLTLQIAYARVWPGDAVRDNLRALGRDPSSDAATRFYINLIFKF